MNPVRVLTFAAAAFLAGEAMAQTPWPAAPAPGSPGIVTAPPAGAGGPPPPMAPMSPMGGGMPQQQQQPPCASDFIPLREEAEKRASVIRAASEGKKKLTQPEACAAFRALVTAEGKVVKFIVDKHAQCGIPEQAIGQVKANHARTTKIRDQVCNAARAPGPAAPSLSDALGTSRVPDASSTSTGRGTLDTLTAGNPLAR